MYLLYVRRELKQTDSHDAELPSPQAGSARQDPGARQGWRKPWWRSVVVALAAQLFVHQLENMGELFGLSPVWPPCC